MRSFGHVKFYVCDIYIKKKNLKKKKISGRLTPIFFRGTPETGVVFFSGLTEKCINKLSILTFK